MKKVILITGASSGIGKATALKLIKEGHTVYGVARRLEKMQDIVEAGGKALKLDVTNHNQIQSTIKEIIDSEGRIDVLVNNAGYAIWGAVEDVTYEDAKRQFEVNLFGLAEVTKAVLPNMRERKTGQIINITSIGGKIYSPLGAWYHATKHALEGWSDCLRLEVEEFGIDVVIIQPGAIRTEFGEVLDKNFANKEKSIYKRLIKLMERAMVINYEPKNSSPASVIADTIEGVIRSSKPKTRYYAGKLAKETLFMRRWLPDRVFDKMIMKMISK